jgi:hypothetical protein
VSLALAGSGAGAPLRQWGDEDDGAGGVSQSTLYRWEPENSTDHGNGSNNELSFGEAKQSGGRSYSRLRVYGLAALVAVIVVVAYMVLLGGDSQPAVDSDPAQDVPVSEPESAPETAPAGDPATTTPTPVSAAEESSEPVAAATEQAPEPGNSLTLTFDSPQGASTPGATATD